VQHHCQSGDKLYAITRRDLPPGYQAVQSAHAYVRFAVEHPEITQDWITNSEYMCMLSVENEEELKALFDEARRLGIPAAGFLEPDIDFQLTAICLAPGPLTKMLCANLNLALREYS
jgi:peptidyl-tRNA hydrolase